MQARNLLKPEHISLHNSFLLSVFSLVTINDKPTASPHNSANNTFLTGNFTSKSSSGFTTSTSYTQPSPSPEKKVISRKNVNIGAIPFKVSCMGILYFSPLHFTFHNYGGQIGIEK